VRHIRDKGLTYVKFALIRPRAVGYLARNQSRAPNPCRDPRREPCRNPCRGSLTYRPTVEISRNCKCQVSLVRLFGVDVTCDGQVVLIRLRENHITRTAANVQPEQKGSRYQEEDRQDVKQHCLDYRLDAQPTRQSVQIGRTALGLNHGVFYSIRRFGNHCARVDLDQREISGGGRGGNCF